MNSKKKNEKTTKKKKMEKKKLYHFPQNAKNDPFRRRWFRWKNTRKASELETKRKVASIVGWVTFRDYITPRGQSSCYSADPRCAPRLIWATNWMSLTRGCAMAAKWPENGQRVESHRKSCKSSRKSSVFFSSIVLHFLSHQLSVARFRYDRFDGDEQQKRKKTIIAFCDVTKSW